VAEIDAKIAGSDAQLVDEGVAIDVRGAGRRCEESKPNRDQRACQSRSHRSASGRRDSQLS
jgi:hypothetical protein